MPVCVLFESSTTGIIFNPSADAVSDYSQSAKNVDPYLSSSSVEDPGHRKPVLISPDGLNKPGERAHDRNTFTLWVGFEPATS